MKKLIIFDMDGTILNTLFDLKNAVNVSLFNEIWKKRSLEQVRKDIGNGVQKLVERSLPKDSNHEDYQRALSIFVDYYSRHYMDETKPYEGIKDELIKLKQNGFLLAVCTNKLRSVAIELTDTFFPNIFDYVQGDEEGLKKKPATDMIDKIIAIFGLPKESILYVGDTEIDLQTAQNSKLDSIIVSYGYRTKDELKVICPNVKTLDKPKELYKEIIKC